MKAIALGVLTVIAATTMFTAPSTAEQAQTRSLKPRVLCLNSRSGNFYVRARPSRCDFYDARAPSGQIVGLAVYPSRGVRWTHWGYRFAYGKGRYHVNGPGFVPARFRLVRPRNACGRLMFTKLRVRINIPGDGWQRWGRGAPIRSCP